MKKPCMCAKELYISVPETPCRKDLYQDMLCVREGACVSVCVCERERGCFQPRNLISP